MLNSVAIQRCYNNLYIQLRKYIWDFRTVEDIAHLEVECYSRFPSLDEVSKYYYKVYSNVKDVLLDDEEFQKACEEFEKLLEDKNNPIYMKLTKVQEVTE